MGSSREGTFKGVVMNYKHTFYKNHFGKAKEMLKLHSPAKKVLKIIYEKGIKARSLLDIGCGDGTVTIKLRHALQSKEVYGIDISDEALRIAHKRGLKC